MVKALDIGILLFQACFDKAFDTLDLVTIRSIFSWIN